MASQSILAWLTAQGMGKYAEGFALNDIDFDVLPSLGDSDLEKLGVASMGHRKKFLNAIADLGTARPFAAKAIEAPQRHTPVHLAERILSSKTTLEGERKQVTVLFADLKGSMEMLADRDPEDARAILDPVLERMLDAVHRFEGTVNQIMGDGIMALFGAPLAHEDHAVRACYAALNMQETISRLGDELQRTHGVPLQLRVGLHSGEVVVRSISNDLHMDYSAIGQTTHLAARMEQMAKAGTVLLTPATLRLCEGYVHVRALGPAKIKGLTEPMEVYELQGASSVRNRLQASVARGLTRFVGRQREIDVLAETIARARLGKGQGVAILGEPGVGKSRLFHEFLRSYHTQGWSVVQASSVSYGKATPYLPVIDLLKNYFRIGERDDTRGIREKVIGKLLALDRALEILLSPILGLLDQPTHDPAWETLDPPQRRRRVLDALRMLWLREAQLQPLILVFEDLHWIDSETQEFLNAMMDSIPAARILLLFNYRPEYQHPWGSRTYYAQLRLDALNEESAQDLLTGLIGDDEALRPLKMMLIARTDGNPFYLEESVRSLVETDVLQGERGQTRLVKPVDAIEVPVSVQAILAARIDRLPVANKQLLQTAAVIGKNVPYVILREVADLADATLREALAQLQDAEFVYEATLFPDLEYTFKHALTHEVAYGTLLQERRKAVHALIVQATERLYSGRLTELAEHMGHHAMRAEDWEKAARYLGQSAAKAYAQCANHEAIAFYDQAIEALRRLPPTREHLEEGILLRFGLRNALTAHAVISRIDSCLAEAQVMAEQLGERRYLARAKIYLSHIQTFMGQHHGSIASGQFALNVAHELDNLDLRIGANYYLAMAHHNLGNFAGTVRHAQDCFESIPEERIGESFGLVSAPAIFGRIYYAFGMGEQGRFSEAIPVLEEALRVADVVGDSRGMAYACVGGAVYLLRGDIPNALRLLERGVSLSEGRHSVLLPWTLQYLASAYAYIGRHDESHQLFERCEALYFRDVAKGTLSYTYSLWAQADLMRGDIDSATRHAQQAEQLARQFQQQGDVARVQWVMGEIHAAQGIRGATLAKGCYETSLEQATRLGMRPLMAHCHFGLGRLAIDGADGGDAIDQIDRALALYEEMAMPYWLEKARGAR